MRNRSLTMLLLIAILLSPLCGGRAWAQPGSGDKPHWAQGAFDFFMNKGAINGDSFKKFDEPIRPEDWNNLVSSLFGIAPGDDGIASSLRWTINSYTAPDTSGKVLRGDGVSGLLQLLDLFGALDLSSMTLPAMLKEIGGNRYSSWEDAFGDWNKVDVEDRLGVAAAIKEGILSGYPGGALRPKESLTHGEALVIALRAVERYSLFNVVLVPRIPSVNVASLEADGLAMLVYTDKAVYKPGDAVSIVAGVKNLRDSNVWCVDVPGGPWIDLCAQGPGGRTVLGTQSQLPFYDVLVEKGPITPGSWVVRRAIYTPSAPGAYVVKMSFRPSQGERRPSKTVTMTVDLTFQLIKPSSASSSWWYPR
jgi:hypothetical protein